MKTPLLQRVLLLYLMGFSSGELQDFFPQGCGNMARLVPFNMAATSFDDQYNGCVDRMEDKVRELHDVDTDTEYWKEAEAKWNETKASISVPESFRAEYAIATLAYTQKNSSFAKYFNMRVENGGQSEDYYLKYFYDKAFHFYLTRAIQLLQNSSSFACRHTYLHVKGIRFLAEYGSMVRFGYFASSSLKWTQDTICWEDTYFTINTCYGAHIKDFSFQPEEEEVLIPPFEVFQVVNSVVTEKDGTHISLLSAGTSSKYNCVYVNGAGRSNLHADGWMPFLFWGFLLVTGALGTPDFV